MHMADALISPAVGAGMWAASAGLIGYSSKKLRQALDDRKAPLMGVIGAFIFAAQMINFTIPGTGSSGHLGGGMILAILLGPHAAFLTMASVLTVQALFFADGGLLALGCNIFNLGFFPCFVCYPLIYRPVVKGGTSPYPLITGSILSAVLGLQAGAFCVVLETFFSGISDLPLATFFMLMQPIHLAIGLVEGITTAAVILFIWKSRPEMVAMEILPATAPKKNLGAVLAGFAVAAAITGGALSWFASSHPDGLEWAIFKTTGTGELKSEKDGLHSIFSAIQEKTALLPDYGYKTAGPEGSESESEKKEEGAWPSVDSGTSVSGLVGGFLTLCLILLIGFLIKQRKKKPCSI